MSEETLIGALEEDARAQSGRILEEARAAAESVLDEVRAEVARERDRRAIELDAAMRHQRASLLNAARTRASGASLLVRHNLIDKALYESVKRFASMPPDEYREFLNQLFFELLAAWERHMPAARPVVLVNRVDLGLLETSFTVRADEGVSLGVVLVSEDGTVRFEDTVASRLERAKAAMTPAINEMLFDGVFP